MMLRAGLAIFAMLASITLATAQALPSGSRWTNQRGSDLFVVYVQPDGKFTGLYTKPGFGIQLPGYVRRAGSSQWESRHI